MKSKPIRLTSTSYALMALLDQLGEATSYDIKQALEKTIENFWPVPHTTAYEEPARLAAAGYLSARQEPGGRRRKSYVLTERGREALSRWIAEPSAAPPQMRDEAMLKVFAGADPRPLREPREAWHREKLEELGGYLEQVREAEGWKGSERALLTGIAYHQMMLELLEARGDG
ncbi:MAG TPA: helix-turn-helix transcriptional regulator [Solirubrobacterales bacterium]